MGSKLLDCIGNDSIVDLCDDQIVAIVSWLKANSLQDRDTPVDFGHASLHCLVVQVHLPEFLVARVFLNVLEEGGYCLEASLGDAWSPNLRVESLDSLDAVFDKLGRRFLILCLLCRWLAPESFSAITLKLLPHAGFFAG